VSANTFNTLDSALGDKSVNLKHLAKRIGANFRLRPLPERVDASGQHLPSIDDFWRLDRLLDAPNRLELHNISTGHSVALQTDNVREFRSPDFLMLRCQLILRPTTVEIEPIIKGGDKGTDRSVSGVPAALLRLCIVTESGGLFEYTEAGTAIDSLDITPEEYRDSALELEELGAVTLHPNMNHESRIARTVLEPEMYLQAAPQLSLGFDARADFETIADELRSAPSSQSVPVKSIVENTAIPAARIDLTLRALHDLGYLEGRGPGSDEFGTFMEVVITPAGRRLLCGEDGLPF